MSVVTHRLVHANGIRLHEVPDLRANVLLPGCGHWTQQERPEEADTATLGFLRDVAPV